MKVIGAVTTQHHVILTIPRHYWIAWLLGFVGLGFLVPEVIAIENHVPGDTFSERTRNWTHSDTPGGGWNFIALWSLGAVGWLWYLGHILRVNVRRDYTHSSSVRG